MFFFSEKSLTLKNVRSCLLFFRQKMAFKNIYHTLEYFFQIDHYFKSTVDADITFILSIITLIFSDPALLLEVVRPWKILWFDRIVFVATLRLIFYDHVVSVMWILAFFHKISCRECY